MQWMPVLLIGSLSGLGLARALARKAELAAFARKLRARRRARRSGDEEARLFHPVVDPARCLGCGTCVAVCPEEDVLGLVHGQAAVVHGARCQGVGACERECPTGAIVVRAANLERTGGRPDLVDGLRAAGVPGLFLAGELTTQARIHNAVEQGKRAAGEVARSARSLPELAGDEHELLILGAGPAGLACALEARRLDLDLAWIDRDGEVGGSVARYPRHKLVVTEPLASEKY